MGRQMYEVVLLLESNVNDAHNPVFAFSDLDEAMKLVDTFLKQNYRTSIAPVVVDSDE